MKRVAIPIETKNRELYGKVWLAANLLKKKNEVIIGPAEEVKRTLHISKPNVFIAKDAGEPIRDFFKNLRSAGVRVTVLHTEAGINIKKYMKRRDKETFSYITRNFAWGRKQKEKLEEMTGESEKIVVTGNPRFDIIEGPLRNYYNKLGSQYKRNYGEYILLNMNFAGINHFDDNVAKSKSQDRHEYKAKLHSEILLAIHKIIEEFQDTNIIIRPHPSEDHSLYKKKFMRYENAHIIGYGDVRGWISGASVTIHNSCTTGIESAMMNIPTIAYRPIQDEEYDNKLPNIVSNEVDNIPELVSTVEDFVNTDKPYQMEESQRSELEQYFDNINGSSGPRMAEVIDGLNTTEKVKYESLAPDIKAWFKYRAKTSSVGGVVTPIYDNIMEFIGKGEVKKARSYKEQKFPSLSQAEIKDPLSDMVPNVASISITPVSNTNNTYFLRHVKNSK